MIAISSNTSSKAIYVKTTVNDVFLPDAPFPPSFIPTANFNIASYIDHCNFPWLVATDPLTSFLSSGGNFGGVTGASIALKSVQDTMDINNKIGNFSSFGNAPGPRFGYCIGNKFKQHIYVRMEIINNTGVGVIPVYSGIELLENGRFKRIYVIEGEISGYKFVNNEHLISLGISKSSPPINISSGILTITNSSGSSTTLNIQGIKSNWDIIVSQPSPNAIPKIGDYYSLDVPWCIEDPYLLTGYWSGSEDDLSKNASKQQPPVNRASSGYNLYVTQHNSPYEEGSITGVYIWKEQTQVQVGNTVTTVTPSTTTSNNLATQPVSGSSMADAAGYEWAFWGFNGSQNYPADYSDTYKNDTRYKETGLDDTTINGDTTTRAKATTADYNSLISNSLVTYIRLEIGKGGHYDRNNWHAPCLKGCYIKLNGSKYKILDHVESNIIDVSVKSIDGKQISIGSSTKYSIINQNAWMIVEDYYEDSGSFKRTGIMEGTVTSVGDKALTMLVSGNPPLATKTNTSISVSMMDRYQKDISLSSKLIKEFNKQDDWRIIEKNSDQQYPIVKATYSIPSTNVSSYSVSIDFITPQMNKKIAIGSTIWFVTGDPYEPFIKALGRKGGYSLILNISSGGGSNASFLTVSDSICVDGAYQSTIYRLDIGGSDLSRVGICDGFYFGIAANGTSLNRMGVVCFINAARGGRGIASLFSTLRTEGWVVYNDVKTGKVTIRKGTSDFKDSPVKSDVVIGKSLVTKKASLSGSEITFDNKQDRVRRVSIQPKVANKIGDAIMFGLGSSNTSYGFAISGDGIVDLQMLRYLNVKSGTVNSNVYVDSNNLPVSPVYVYRKSPLQPNDYIDVDIGMDTTQTLYVKDANDKGGSLTTVSDAVAQYVNDNQVLENNAFFDIERKVDGEVFLIYGQTTKPFNMESSGLNNDSTNKTQWGNSSAVYIISSADEGVYWGTPTKLKHGDVSSGGGIQDEDKYQYPVMVINSVDYLSCIYNPITDVLCIFVNAIDGKSNYIGCFSISTQSLTHTTYNCSDKNYDSSQPENSDKNKKADLKFLYRPPLIEDAFIKDKTKSWISSNQDLIKTPFDVTKVSVPMPTDIYVRILGPKSTSSYVENTGIVGIIPTISTSILPDGTYILLYNGVGGVKAVFSQDQGISWLDSNIILDRNSKNAILLGDYLFSISSNGIVMKHISSTYIMNAIKKAGNNTTSLEKKIQDEIDKMESILISEPIDDQRISGYITSEQYYRIFFYDTGNRLTCVGSQDSFNWGIVDNF